MGGLLMVSFFLADLFFFVMGSAILTLFMIFRFKLSPVFTFSFYHDSVSSVFVILTLLMVLLCFWLLDSSMKNLKLVKSNLIFLLVMLKFSFFSTTIFSFFIFFELGMIPMMLLIIGWGSQPERLKATLFFFLYTFLGALPLLVKMLGFFYKIKSCNFVKFVYNLDFSYNYYLYFMSLNYMVLLFWVLAFLMKLPIFGFHLWLPKAHVEAPTVGSMILAGILLKLGVYGLYRLGLMINSLIYTKMFNFFLSWLMMGSLICSFQTFCFHDLKSMVAYSSVVHMSVLGLIFFFFKWLGLFASLVISVSHGFVSSGLFLSVGGLYNNSNSRSILVKNGLFLSSPLFLFSFLILCGLKMSFPPFMKFLGELLMFKSMITFSYINIFPLLLIMFFVGLYKIYLYSLLGHGKGFLSQSQYNLSNSYLLKLVVHMIISMIIFWLLNFFI